MATSPEYPDLAWVPPKAWSNANRGSVQLIVIHTTEGSEGPNSAEDGAAYDARRTDGTSTHFFHDSTSTVQCVRTADIAYAARSQGNKRGIQHELCGRAGQGTAGWADEVSRATLWRAAAQCARDARKWGIPVRKLSPTDVSAGAKGICGHADITKAFPLDSGTHTDPGPTFPWAEFLDMVRIQLEIDMTAAEDIAQAVANKLYADVKNAKSGLAVWADGRQTAVLNAIAGVPDALLDKLGDSATSDEQVAAALVSLLGARKDAILALMQ